MILNTCEPFYRGGYEARAWALAKTLAQRGHDVTIFTSCNAPQTIESVQFVPLLFQLPYFNTRGVRNGWADVLFALATFRLLWRRKLPALLDATATPFLHLPILKWICRMRGVAFLVTAMEGLDASLADYATERGWKRGIFVQGFAGILRLLYRTGMRAAGATIAISETTRRNLEREAWKIAAVVPCGLEGLKSLPFPFKPPITADRPLEICFIGRLVPAKRVEVLLDALAQLGPDAKKFRLTIAGDGGCAAALRMQVKMLEFEQTEIVKFLGPISEMEKYALLERMDLFVLPSLREGFSISTLEAMAAGCGILAAQPPPPAPGSAAADLVTDGHEGRLWNGSAEALAGILQQLLADASPIPRWQRAAHATAQHYDLDRCADLLEAAYRKRLLLDEETHVDARHDGHLADRKF